MPKLSLSYRFCGSKKPKDPQAGDIYCDVYGTHLCIGNDIWKPLYGTELTSDTIKTPKATVCPHCGAPTNGLDRCEYCGGYV